MAPAGYQHIAYLRRFRIVAYWLVLLSIAGFSIAEPNALVFCVGTIGTIASWWVVERPRGRALPRWMINAGVLFGAFLLFWELVIDSDLQGNLLIGLGHFMVAILICKLFESKQNRDYAQILTLSLLIIVSGAFFNSEISAVLYSFIMLIYLGLGIYALLVLHLRSDTERALGAGSAPAEITMPLERQKRLRKDVRSLAMRLAMIMLVFAAIAFVLIPRSNAREGTAGSLSAGSQQIGFSEESNFHQITNLLENDNPAMLVSLKIDGVEQKLDTGDPYFRGVAYDTYEFNGRKWINAPSTPDRLTDRIDRQDGFAPGAYVQQYETYATIRSNVLFSLAVPPGAPQGSQVLKPSNITSMGDAPHVEPRLNTEDFTLHAGNNTIPPPRNYTITSPRVVDPILTDSNGTPFRAFINSNEFLTGPAKISSETPLGPRRRAYYEELSAVLLNMLKAIEAETATRGATPKYTAEKRLELLRSGKATGDDVDALASDIATHLRENYKYSLTSTFPAGEDPVLYFLRKGKQGHCEYFASSMVLLLRVAGVNARMVAGYHGGDIDGNQLLVRQKDAHAWVEVMIPNRGWCFYDPSPAGGAQTSSSWAWLKSIRNFFRSLEASWFTRVVSFDSESRKEILNSIKNFFGFVGKVIGEIGDFIYSPQSSWQTRVSVTVGVLISLFGGIWLYKKWRHRRISRVSRSLRHLDGKTQRQLEQELAFFDQLMSILARAGEKSDDATPREYVDSLAARLGPAKSDASFLIETFYSVRFGMARMNAQATENVAIAMEKVRLAIAQQR